MEAWLDTVINFLAGLMQQNLWFAPLLSIVAGIVTSFTPCSLSAVPMVLAYMEGTSAKDPKKALRLSIVMALGMAVTFAVFGSIASVIGHLMHEVGHWWSFLMGILMILMALQVWGVIHIFPGSHDEHDHVHGHEGTGVHTHEHKVHGGHEDGHGQACASCGPRKVSKKGYTGAFLTGALGGVFASHCAAPVMVALLAMVAQSEHGPLWGIFLMILYAFGHSILLVLAGTSYSVVDGWMKNPRYTSVSRVLKGVVGAIVFLLGLLLLM
ncbi:MAG: cytochrome c biogenesis CcdA family protein [Blautia sp.]|jgi:cytochrome c-type biogenesis protein